MKARLLFVTSLVLFLPFFAFAQTVDTETDIPTVALLDVIIEADTLVPAFYNGRPEPSPGSMVRAIALMNDTSDANIYTYRWEINGQVRTNDSGSSNPIFEFATPLGNEFRIRVDVFENEHRIASKEMFVPLSDPAVMFYETNLLRGTGRVALTDSHILTGDEMSVRAEPYFMNRTIFTGANELHWRVDGNSVTGLLSDPQVLTLRKGEATGSYFIEFVARNSTAFAQYVSDTFTVTF